MSSAIKIHTLPCHGGYHLVVVPQWLVNFSADPQLVKQYRQLPRDSNDGLFLGILSSPLG
jgi:hypothetical protein